MEVILEKPGTTTTEGHEASPSQWSSASVKRFTRRTSYRLKVWAFAYSVFYLIRHWFDFFCYPWTFDNIFFARQVPYLLSVAIFGGALAWAHKYQTLAAYRPTCWFAALVGANEMFFYITKLDLNKRAPWPYAMNSVCACVIIVAYALCGHSSLEPKQDDAVPVARSNEDPEAARNLTSTNLGDKSLQRASTPSSSRTDHSLVPRLARRLPTLRTALMVALFATATTVTMHPPVLASQYLSAVNCVVYSTELDHDDEHFEFTTTDSNGTFARHCSRLQQPWALDTIMNAHNENSRASCGVWCIRVDEAGNLVGYISQVGYGLVDMYYCRGQYASFGPDCEYDGDDYGYDTTREGWMNDIFEPWAKLQADDGADAVDQDVDTNSASG